MKHKDTETRRHKGRKYNSVSLCLGASVVQNKKQNNEQIEVPFAYTDIAMVMSQKKFVDMLGKFTPKIVKINGAKHKTWVRRKMK